MIDLSSFVGGIVGAVVLITASAFIVRATRSTGTRRKRAYEYEDFFFYVATFETASNVVFINIQNDSDFEWMETDTLAAVDVMVTDVGSGRQLLSKAVNTRSLMRFPKPKIFYAGSYIQIALVGKPLGVPFDIVLKGRKLFRRSLPARRPASQDQDATGRR